MLRSESPRTATPDGTRGQHSLGDLVGLALKDVSQLVRYEINLAKSEFKVDVRRAVVGGLFAGFILVVAYPLIIMLLFAEAYALMDLGAPGGRWGAFLWAALTCAVLAVIAGLIGLVFFKKITGMKLTRKTVSADIDMLKRATSSNGDGSAPAIGKASADGERPAVTAQP
jgi:Na+/H+-dicarboxylate symporter